MPTAAAPYWTAALINPRSEYRHTCYSQRSISGAKLSHDEHERCAAKGIALHRDAVGIRAKLEVSKVMTTSAENGRKRARPAMHTPPVVSPQAWEAARKQLLVKEK